MLLSTTSCIEGPWCLKVARIFRGAAEIQSCRGGRGNRVGKGQNRRSPLFSERTKTYINSTKMLEKTLEKIDLKGEVNKSHNYIFPTL